MNRRAFLKSVPAIAAAMTCLPAAAQVKRLPSSIMLSWAHPDRPERWGTRIWNVYCQQSYDQFKLEAVKMHARLAGLGYGVQQIEFRAIRFANTGSNLFYTELPLLIT